jgi:hypothetical protein
MAFLKTMLVSDTSDAAMRLKSIVSVPEHFKCN